MEDAQRSVRIEVDSLGGAGLGDAPLPDASGPGSSGPRLGLIVGVVAAVGALIALLMLRPESGQTAAGTERQATTTTSTTIAPSTTTSEVDQTTETSAIAVDQAEGFDPNVFIIGVVRAPVGFIAMANDGDNGLAPPIWRSIDGERWEEIETSIDGEDEAERDPSEPTAFAFFTGLERTSTGYSALAIQQSFGPSFDSETAPERTASLVRLTSENGAVWSVADDFPEIDPNSSFPFRLNAQWTVLFDFGQVSAAVESIVDTYIPSLSDRDVCYFERRGTDLAAYPCSFGSEIRLTASDYSVPELQESIQTCLITASNSDGFFPSSPNLRLLDETTAEIVELAFDRVPIGAPQMLTDGTIMLVAAPVETGTLTSACEGLGVVFPEERPAELFVFEDPAGAPRVVAMPQEVLDSLALNFFPTSSREPFDDVAIIFGSSELWSVDRFGTWTAIAEFEGREQFFLDANGFSEDGRTAINANGNTLRLWDLDDAGQVIDSREVTVDTRLPEGQGILHFSGDDLFISEAPGVEYIDLGE